MFKDEEDDFLQNILYNTYMMSILKFNNLTLDESEITKDIYGYKFNINTNKFENKKSIIIINSFEILTQFLQDKSKKFYFGFLSNGNYIFMYDKNVNQIEAYYYTGDLYLKIFRNFIYIIMKFLEKNYDADEFKKNLDISYITSDYDYLVELFFDFIITPNKTNDIIHKIFKPNEDCDFIDHSNNECGNVLIGLNITETFMNYLLINEIKNV